MADHDYDIGIIGGGAAGLTVASGAAQLGAKTLLVEKEEVLGGDCLHFGCVPSKTLIKTAHVYHQMKNGPKFGLPAFSPPPVDFKDVKKRIQSVIGVIQKHDSVERFCRLGVKVVFGGAEFVDEHTIRLADRTVTARSWVIATGSSAAVPVVDGIEATPYLTNREIFSLDELPESLLILGAGPIAIEMAQAFNRLGSRVTVIQRSGQILSKEDKDMADLVQQVLQKEGVCFEMNSSLVRVRDLGQQRQVVIQDAYGQEKTLAARQILVAMGRSPNVEGLGLAKIDIPHDKSGIKVNSYLKTRHKHIYAAGDVSGGYQFTHVAGYEGGVVLSNAIFHLPRKADYSHVPWCTYSRPELACIGLNEKNLTKAGVEYNVFQEEFSANDRGLAEGEEKGFLKLILDTRDKPLGVQILGPHAGDLLGEWVAVMNGGVGLSKLASAIHPYPTLAEINKKAAGSVLAPKIFSNTVKKGLKFFFNFKGRACEPDGDVASKE